MKNNNKLGHVTTISTGFVVLLLLLLVIVFIGINRMEIMHTRLDTITTKHNVKKLNISNMKEGIRKRQVSFHRLFIMDDAFDKDEESQRFYGYAIEVADSINQIQKMELSAQEKNILDSIRPEMIDAYPVQNELVRDAVMDDDNKPDIHKVTLVLDAHLKIIGLLDQLLEIQKNETAIAVNDAQTSYTQAKFAMFALGMGAFLIGVIVAVFVIRLTVSQAGKVRSGMDSLKESRDILEKRVIERTRELAVARDKALSSSRAKGQFLANMSHELRTPLNAIIGYSDILQEDINELGHEHLSSDIGKVRSAGRHLLSLINDVLDLSKIEAGRMEVYIEQFSIKEMLEDVITNTVPLIEKYNNNLILESGDKPGLMSADLTKVRQILLNLISNASKFTENGTIKLEVKRKNISENEWIKFSILDSGIGMTDEQMEKLFSPFQQADSSTTRKYGGTGLGLTISKYFTELMGGKLEVSSIMGEGSQFTVYIPAVVVIPQPEELEGTKIESNPVDVRLKSAAIVSSERRNKVCTVLVIDDDASVRDMLVRYMTKDGFKVETAVNGNEGIQRAKEIKPDIITLDVMMPSLDGWGVLKALKNDASTVNIPVIMLSMIVDKSLGFALGATDYLTKPIDWNKMSDVIKRSVRSKVSNHVLVVEDDMSAREMTKRMLEKEGLEVITANNGAEALEHVRKRNPALILLDLMMPVMDGFEFMRELRANEEWRKIPVVVLTAAELSAPNRKLLRGSVRKIIKKAGIDKESLLKEVRDIIKTRYAESA